MHIKTTWCHGVWNSITDHQFTCNMHFTNSDAMATCNTLYASHGMEFETWPGHSSRQVWTKNFGTDLVHKIETCYQAFCTYQTSCKLIICYDFMYYLCFWQEVLATSSRRIVCSTDTASYWYVPLTMETGTTKFFLEQWLIQRRCEMNVRQLEKVYHSQ